MRRFAFAFCSTSVNTVCRWLYVTYIFCQLCKKDPDISDVHTLVTLQRSETLQVVNTGGKVSAGASLRDGAGGGAAAGTQIVSAMS